MKLYVKDPQAALDYGFSFASWLATGESVSTATWALAPTGTGAIAVDTGFPNFSSGTYNDGSTVLIALQDGVVGTRYTATVHVVTNYGREDDRSFEILVQQR